MSDEKFKDYLGGSVYADFDGHHIILTTENGNGSSNTIFLDPDVMLALDEYRQRKIRSREWILQKMTTF